MRLITLAAVLGVLAGGSTANADVYETFNATGNFAPAYLEGVADYPAATLSGTVTIDETAGDFSSTDLKINSDVGQLDEEVDSQGKYLSFSTSAVTDSYFQEYALNGPTIGIDNTTFFRGVLPVASLINYQGGPFAIDMPEDYPTSGYYLPEPYSDTPFFTVEGEMVNGELTQISAAPEPSTWLLMFAGIGGIGLMLRRAKKTVGFRFKDTLSA